ncbi:MAG: DNA gyrase/topoisomerase IV subunit A [Bacteroidia bacterium]|nr:DNA gyrase/topoisomerase IV subunit A [Bacteroidia bacterium]
MDPEDINQSENPEPLEEPSEEETVISETGDDETFHNIIHLSGMYKDWFLDYASYVILERAVPHIVDGLKPVQRRILHSMKRLDDGRYNKVANIIGHSMQFHPHGDASIGDALVQLGQKNLLIDTQGNWGNLVTGDDSAAPRYIEARLSKFALEVVFNTKTTEWKLSYDGRNKEPVTLPVKFPLLLAQGAEGIAVGLASKILPHNFNEIIDAAIDYLKGKSFILYPDFPTGGLADFSRYNDGLRGGAVRIRSKISKLDKKTLVINEIPFGKTTGGLIESIIKANDKGKIKIKKIDDNTAENVEIVILLQPGVSPDKTIDALYAFTDCEISVSPNCCVIEENKPRFTGVSEILKFSVDNTVALLRKELEIQNDELNEAWHHSTLEKIFIENRIYIEIENCETFESIIETIDKGLEPFKHLLKRKVVYDDIVMLTEIRIKRISKFDSKKAYEQIRSIEEQIVQIQNYLANLIIFAIDYFKRIKTKFGKGRDRLTEIRNFDTIVASDVAVANQKLYVNRKEGFAGTSLKKDEFVCDCSDIDDVIIFMRDGTYRIMKVSEKSFVGKEIVHIGIFRQDDERTIYNLVYWQGKSGPALMKRFFVKGITRDKIYNISREKEGTKVLYISANANGEAELVKVFLKPKSKLRRLVFDLDFRKLSVKGRSSVGNMVTRHEVHKVELIKKGESTLGGRNIWFDEEVLRLNSDSRGRFIGEFHDDEKIIVFTKDGNYYLTSYDLTNHYEDEIFLIEKYDPDKVFSAVYFDGSQKYFYLKRFCIEPGDKKSLFISEEPGSKLVSISEDEFPRLELKFGGKQSDRQPESVDVSEFVGVKGVKAKGKRLSTYSIKSCNWLEPLVKEAEDEPEEINYNEEDVDFEVVDTRETAEETKSPETKLLDSLGIQMKLDI